MVSSTPRQHFTPGKDPVPILQEAGWTPGPIWTGGKSRPHRDSIPDRPAHSQSLYRLSHPAYNQRYPNPIFITINPLGLLPDFLISSSLSATRNNILSTDRVPLKSHVPNFTAQFTKLLASPAKTTKFPFCCSLAVFFGLLTTFYELFPALL